MKTENLFRDESAWKVIRKMCIPTVITMLVMVLYNMTDMFFIGRTGNDLYIAAISLAHPIFLILMTFGTLIGTGGCSSIARLFGKGEFDKVKNYSSLCAWGSIIVGLLFAAAVFFNQNRVLEILGTPDEVIEYTRSYLVILTLGSPFILFASVFSNIIRAEGSAKESMIGNGIGTLCNIILDPIFIFGFNLGVSGAAAATVIGNVATCCYYVFYYLKKDTRLSIDIKFAKPNPAAIAAIISLGFPGAINNFLLSISQTFSNNLVKPYGAGVIAAMSVAGKAGMVISMVSMGICIGIQPALAYNYGNGNYERTKELTFKTGIVTFIVGLSLTSLCYIFRNNLVALFVSDEQVVSTARHIVSITMLTGPMIGFYFLSTSLLQASGNAFYASLVPVIRQGLLYIPSLYLLNHYFQLNGIICNGIVVDLISTVVAFTLCYMQLRQFKSQAVLGQAA